MPRLLALEWNDVEARVAIASSHGGRVVFEQAFAVDLSAPEPPPATAGRVGIPEPSETPAAPETPQLSEAEIGERIAAALAARHVGRAAAVVAVGRSDVELRRLSIPPAPDEELPDMVRFQAMREFSGLGDDWPLDFLPLDADPTQPRNVLAAAISPDLLASTQAVCHAAGLKPTSLVLRPCAAASLLCRQRPAQPEQLRLLVDLLADEVDLTVTVGDSAAFLRRARLRGDPLAVPAAAEALLSEIRRTIVAAQNQLGAGKIESVVLCGASPQHAALADSIREQLGIGLETFDPFAGVALEGDLRRALPDHPDRFAPLLGMLWDELESRPHALDFLKPRRPPAPPSRRNIYVLAGLGAALVVLLMLAFGWIWSARLTREITRLGAESKKLDPLVEKANQLQQAADQIEAWTSAQVRWLDELAWLSKSFPDPQDAMLKQLTLTAMSSGRGVMTLDGQARSVEAVTKLDRQLQQDSDHYEHRLEGKTKSEDESKKPYPIQFRASLQALPKDTKAADQKADAPGPASARRPASARQPARKEAS